MDTWESFAHGCSRCGNRTLRVADAWVHETDGSFGPVLCGPCFRSRGSDECDDPEHWNGPNTTPPSLSAGRYSEALEWQLRLADEFERYHGAEGKREARAIRKGDPFYVAPEVCRLIAAASASLTSPIVNHGSLPGPYGFVWLGAPLRQTNVRSDGAAMDLLGLSWAYGIAGTGRDLIQADDSFWNFDNANYIEILAWHHVPPRGRHSASFQIPLGKPVLESDSMNGASDIRFAYRQTQWFSAFLAFIQQRLLTTRAARPDRATRRRINSLMPETEIVRVVELRRKEVRHRDTGERVDVDWSCQWVVRGHWHNYHTKDGLQPRWITPYVKGPENKPLKPPRATVFAVVR